MITLVPYIGVNDFLNFSQVEYLLEVHKKHLPSGVKRNLHVGVMTTRKIMLSIPNEYQDIFPPTDTIKDVFSSSEAYNCLHFVDYRKVHEDLAENLLRAAQCSGPLLHAIQLDMTWPDPKQIASAARKFERPIEIILQVGRRALESIANPEALTSRLSAYAGIIHRVLLDKSMGEGLEMNAHEALPYLRAIRNAFPELGLVKSGGLGPNSVSPIIPALREFPDLSWDAQGKLRPSGSIKDPMELMMAAGYLIESLGLTKSDNLVW